MSAYQRNARVWERGIFHAVDGEEKIKENTRGYPGIYEVDSS
jgi:hypothetical protein